MIINFLKELKQSFPDAQKVFMEGSCFRLHLILKTIFPSAIPYYSTIDGHWIIKIDGSFYDINGRISECYVRDKEYEAVVDSVILESAKVPTYKGQSVSYSKYEESV